MVNVFNRKLIYSGSDAEDAACVWSTLKAAGVPYSMQTKGVQSRLVGGVHARMGMNLDGRERALLRLCRRCLLHLPPLRQKKRLLPRRPGCSPER